MTLSRLDRAADTGYRLITSLPPMTDQRKLPARPPRGMIEIDGKLQVRRYGLLVQRELTCIYGHRIKPDARPFEIAIPCNHRDAYFDGARHLSDFTKAACSAQLYIFTTRAKLLWAMDLTHDESTMIAKYELDVNEIVDHFGVGFPIEMKIARL